MRLLLFAHNDEKRYNRHMKNIPYIPYFQTSRYRVATMVELAKIKPGEKAADLGTGDGRIAIALTKAGAIVTAFELDEKLIKIEQENIDNAFTPAILKAREALPAGRQGSQSINSDSSQAQNDNKKMLKQVQHDRIKPVVLKNDFWYE